MEKNYLNAGTLDTIIKPGKVSEEKDWGTISTENARIVIVLRGGLITDVYSSNRNVNIEIIDFDVQDSEEVEAADKAMNEVIADVNNGTMLAVY